MKTVYKLYAKTVTGDVFPLDEPRSYVKGTIAEYIVYSGYGMLKPVFHSSDIKECKFFIRAHRDMS